MNLVDRLRGVVRPPGGLAGVGPACSPNPPYVRRPGSTDACSLRSEAAVGALADTAQLDGEWRGPSGQQYLVIDRSYSPGYRHGRVAVADGAPGQDGGWDVLSVLEPSITRARLVFIDLETTGLAGGAGTYAFLVGCGWFDNATFKVRQFLLTSYGAERGLLVDVADTVGAAGALVTYNGKTFDLPLLETRFLFHRMTAPFPDIPHVDLLHTARRLWRATEDRGVSAVDTTRPKAVRDYLDGETSHAKCRLGILEQSVLGHVREHDVPGYGIPSRYFQFVRSGDDRPLVAVLEHNRLDLLSLALLTARTARLLEEGADAARTPRDAYGLGSLYQRAGLLDQARACFARASVMSESDPGTSAEALRACAVLARRARQYDEAATAWRRILELRECQPRLIQEASEALAVHHEHRDQNLHLARDLARRSLHVAGTASRAQAVHHRIARLERKLAASRPDRGSTRASALLF